MRAFHPDVPFAPRRTPFFYGWVVLVASTLGVLMSIPGQTTGVSAFTEPLLAATGLSRLSLANAYLCGTLTSAMLLPRGGRLLDRFGSRPTVVLSALGLALTLLWLRSVDHIGERFSLVIGASAGAWVPLALGFTALRFSGQGMLTMVSRTMLGKWFEARRGLTAAVSGVFVSFGFASAPAILEEAIVAVGWRDAWGAMSIVLLAMAALGWLLFRDNPEQCGLRMDGAAPSATARTDEPADTRAEALRSPAFWALALALATQATVITGFTFHIGDLGAEAGLPRPEAMRIFLPVAICSTATGALTGWAADRARIRTLVFVMIGAQVVGYLGAANFGHPIARLFAIAGIGVAGGFFGPLISVALPRYFGRAHLGAIAGVSSMLMVIGSALGPSLFALSRQAMGSYAPGLYACAALPCVVFVLNVLAKHPRDVPPRGARS